MPPRGVSGTLAPAQLELKMLPAGEFTISPLGTVMKATAFPAVGERGGPTVAISLRNITGSPLRISVRLVAFAPELDKVATVRGSVAGAVVLRGGIETTGKWTRPMGLVRSGESTTLRLRFKLKTGIDPDQYAGRLDIRQIEVKGTAPGMKFDVPSDEPKIVPGTEGTTPATTPLPPNVSPTPVPSPKPTATATPDPNAPKRRAPDEG
ncbi:MAG: hypothetical protein J7513_07770 [Solirubrobacteraceae bacterium]|nr:hypothetical protein [Solirubrobacteraceae bacterium]